MKNMGHTISGKIVLLMLTLFGHQLAAVRVDVNADLKEEQLATTEVKSSAKRIVTSVWPADQAGQIAMLSGSITANEASIAALGAQVAGLTQFTMGLAGQVATLTEVAQPTIALASVLGVPAGQVSALALAGSFSAPVLGVLMLVYVCWPDEKDDPWWRMEERVQQMINDRFNMERRKRLTSRLKRYVMELSTCSTAWIEQAAGGSSNPSGPGGHTASGNPGDRKEHNIHTVPGGNGGDIAWNDPTPSSPQAAPACMEQLEMHMSLERDEWTSTQGNSFSGLFMPFANLHTQIQQLLLDYPSKPDHSKHWQEKTEKTSAEYANFIMKSTFDAWKNQMCRVVRLRHTTSVANLYATGSYQLVVLSPVWQPHAAEECFEHCGSEGGWCNYCGGRNVGACCRKGAAQMNPPEDPSECLQFDPPTTYHRGKAYHSCVHTDCAQSNTYYRGGKRLTILHNVTSWENCQEHCKLYVNTLPEGTLSAHDRERVVFSMKAEAEGQMCKCRSGDYYRTKWEGATSGPVQCREEAHQDPAQTEEAKEQTPHVPMEELKPCSDSPDVASIDELQEKHIGWLQQCYTNVTKIVTHNFNPFYSKFAKFVDRLAWKAGCGEHPSALGSDDFTGVSSKFDFASFLACDWEKEKKRGNDASWVPDAERDQSGLVTKSKVELDAQAKLKMFFPLPEWMHRRQPMLNCLATAVSQGEDGGMTIGSAESNVVGALQSFEHSD